LLIALYKLNSEKQNIIFFSILLLVLLSNIFILFNFKPLFYEIIFPSISRVLIIYLIFNLIKKINYWYSSLITICFLLVFFYLISVTNEISTNNYNLPIFQSILISITSGVALSSYIVDDNRQNSWLLISILLFIGIRFMLFIQSYYLTDLTLPVINPIIIILNVFAYFTFYKFVIEAEVTDKE